MKLSAALVLALALGASAQVAAPYYENFDSGVPAGWTFDAPSTEGVGWGVDATPALIGGVTPSTFPPASPSAGSLNFNDGVDFEDTTPEAVKGYATSPAIDITGLGGTVIIWWSMAYEVEPFAYPAFDIREIYILDDTDTIVATFQVGEVGSGADIELAPTTWATYFFDASVVLAGSTSCKFQVVFSSVDEGLNDYSGWFIDDVRVTCGDSVPPPGVTHLTPPDGAIVTAPVALDWTDSADTSDCGSGQIFGYTYEVDDDPLFGSIDFTALVTTSDAAVAGVPAGTWYWRVLAIDTGLNFSPYSTSTSFVVEPALPPAAPDSRFVNESSPGAQGGDAGFVNPVVDQRPAFSAVYRDPNTVDNAIGLRFQVSEDPTFLTLDFDSGSVAIAPVLPKDTRCPDLTVNVDLQHDTVYYWRIQFTDASGATGPFSASQSFRIGDDFEFGVRKGSSHHGRRCYVATAAFGADSEPVRAFQDFRAARLESIGAGELASRAYVAIGSRAADVAPSGILRATLIPLRSATSSVWVFILGTVLLLGACRQRG
ncbi:MAG: hypothetical protein IT452_16835 [Planctomycetia bacterium]|nr:hypothetical protein [Planctomycetia bacterium]